MLLKTLNLSLERLKWMKPWQAAEDRVNIAGEYQGKVLSLAFIRETVKNLLFLSPPGP